MIALFIAWRLFRHVRKLLLLVVLAAAGLALSHHWLARVGDPAFWRSELNTVQHQLKRSIEHGLQPAKLGR